MLTSDEISLLVLSMLEALIMSDDDKASAIAHSIPYEELYRFTASVCTLTASLMIEGFGEVEALEQITLWRNTTIKQATT